MTTFLLRNKRATEELGRALARKLLSRQPATHAQVIALLGDLGVGKTTLARGFLRASGIRGRVTSPTFLIAKRYLLRRRKYAHVFHLDLYRLRRAHELKAIEFASILEDPQALVLIEWAGKVLRRLPRSAIIVRLEHVRPNKRRAVLRVRPAS